MSDLRDELAKGLIRVFQVIIDLCVLQMSPKPTRRPGPLLQNPPTKPARFKILLDD